MLKAENTPNNTGILVSGTFEDLDLLYDALIRLTKPLNEELTDDSPYYDTAMHILGFCYELRHANMGNREFRFVDNNIDKELMKSHGMICPIQNIEYAFPVLWLESLFVVAALTLFIELRAQFLAKSKYIYRPNDYYKLFFDKTTATARNFQAVVMEALHAMIGDHAYARAAKLISNVSDHIFYNFCSEYLNLLSVEYLSLEPEARKKKLSTYIKRIFEYGEDYTELKETISVFAKENNCHSREVRLDDIKIPDIIEW